MSIPPVITPSRESRVGSHTVRRALPRRDRRTVGAWCFADHMGPAAYGEDDPVGVGPHPHIGLQTVTWLVEGELLHRDNLGTEQTIAPGQLNLMTAGHGVSHAEENVHARGALHGIQLWVAQPEATRHGDAAFEHHGELPQLELPNGRATVLVGMLGEVSSTARRDTDHFGAELLLRSGPTVVPVERDHEHALVVLDGSVAVGGETLRPGNLAYLQPGRDELPLAVDDACRVMLLGGEPFGAKIKMWWNFVGRDTDEIDVAAGDWNAGSDRFGDTGSTWDRIPAPATPWS